MSGITEYVKVIEWQNCELEEMGRELDQARKGHLACIMVVGKLMHLCDKNGLHDECRAAINAALNEEAGK